MLIQLGSCQNLVENNDWVKPVHCWVLSIVFSQGIILGVSLKSSILKSGVLMGNLDHL